MMIAEQKKLIPAAGYIRMSTAGQTASPDRQRRDALDYAPKHGLEIVRWYQDLGLSGTTDNRPEFQSMLEDGVTGKGGFRAIVIHEPSRFSREDVFDVVGHWSRLTKAGIALHSVQRGEIRFDDLGSLVTAIVEQHGAKDESIKLSARVVSGKMAALSRGENPFGGRFFAYDREYYSPDGQLQVTVSFRDKFASPPGWRRNLIPTRDRKTLEAVCWMFPAFLAGATIQEIGRELNRRGVTTGRGNPFDESAVKRVLTAAPLCGRLVVGGAHVKKTNKGKFCRMNDGEETVIVGAHEAVISPETFDRVQVELKRRDRIKRDRHDFRSPLRGLLFCGYCGERMYSHGTAGKFFRRRDHYSCQHRLRTEHLKCPHPSIKARVLESVLLKLIRRTVLSDNNIERIPDLIEQVALAPEGAAPERRKLAEIRENIARATNNLPLAESQEDFSAISNFIKKQRADERAQIEQVRQRSRSRHSGDSARRAIMELSSRIDKLDQASPAKLGALFRAVFHRISFRRTVERNGRQVLKVPSCTVEFRPEVYEGAPVVLTDRDFSGERPHVAIAEFIRQRGRAVLLPELADEFKGTNSRYLCRLATLAVMGGLLEKIGPRQGWRAPADVTLKLDGKDSLHVETLPHQLPHDGRSRSRAS
jgi:site-specific DNA recombinase